MIDPSNPPTDIVSAVCIYGVVLRRAIIESPKPLFFADRYRYEVTLSVKPTSGALSGTFARFFYRKITLSVAIGRFNRVA